MGQDVNGIDPAASPQRLGDLLDPVTVAVEQDGLRIGREPLQKGLAVGEPAIDEDDLAVTRRTLTLVQDDVGAGEGGKPVRPRGTGCKTVRIDHHFGVIRQGRTDTLEQSLLVGAERVEVDRAVAEREVSALAGRHDLDPGDAGAPPQVLGDAAEPVLVRRENQYFPSRPGYLRHILAAARGIDDDEERTFRDSRLAGIETCHR